MRKEGCIFCMIANGEIPARTVYENEHLRVILDNAPATRGHALVMPKEHYADITEIPVDLAGEVMRAAAEVARIYKEKLGFDGLNLIQNNGELAGQTVHHFHLHIIPRYKGDGQRIGWKPSEPTAEQLDAVLASIKG